MLRQQIISSVPRQSSDEEFQQRQLALAQLGPQEQQAYQMAEAGRAIGRAVGKAFGRQTQQEHDIQIYKQNCE
jgi:N-formylglutamate amidohydrolase